MVEFGYIVIAWSERSSLVLALGLAWSEFFLNDVRDFSSCLACLVCFVLFFACFSLFVEVFLAFAGCCALLFLSGLYWILLGRQGRKEERILFPPSSRRAARAQRASRGTEEGRDTSLASLVSLVLLVLVLTCMFGCLNSVPGLV